MGIIRIARSRATSKADKNMKMSKVLTHLPLSDAKLDHWAAREVPQAVNRAMKKAKPHNTATPISAQLAMLKARPRKIRR